MKRKKIHPLVETASAFVGFTARPQGNPFLINAGVPNSDFQWDGAFVDAMLEKLYQTGRLPKTASSTEALAFYIRNGWQRRAPKPGDLVYFSYPGEGTATAYLSPRVGIVSSTDGWRANGTFRVIEGQTDSGQPKGPQDRNGVYERTHYATDVTAFVRIPNRYLGRDEETREEATPTSHIVRPAHLERCSSSSKTATAKPAYRKSTELVQLALSQHPASNLRNADRQVYNNLTASAMAAFQRFQGHPASECLGYPNVRSLTELAASPYVSSKFEVDN